MNIKFDYKKTSSIINDFSLITKSCVYLYDLKLNLIHSSDQAEISKEIYAAVSECKRKKTAVESVLDNFLYIAIPLMKDGVFAAFLLIKSEENSSNQLSKNEKEALLRLVAESLFSSAISVELPYALKKAVGYIALNLSKDLSLKVLCNISHCSKNMLYKLFDDAFGCTVNDYIVIKRIEAAKFLLETTDKNITEVGKSVGMPSNAHFCRAFIKYVDLSPTAYRTKYKEERI